MLIAFKKPDLLFLELVELFLIDFLGIQNLSDAKHTPDGRKRDHMWLADTWQVRQDGYLTKGTTYGCQRSISEWYSVVSAAES